MLINLTNHPYRSWSARQVEVALDSFGMVVDLAFPAIDPHSSTAEIVAIASDFSSKIINILENSQPSQPSAVHIMGESTFCFTLVSMLIDAGIQCVASTTKRNVIFDDSGIKSSIFEFVQFRPYSK